MEQLIISISKSHRSNYLSLVHIKRSPLINYKALTIKHKHVQETKIITVWHSGSIQSVISLTKLIQTWPSCPFGSKISPKSSHIIYSQFNYEHI